MAWKWRPNSEHVAFGAGIAIAAILGLLTAVVFADYAFRRETTERYAPQDCETETDCEAEDLNAQDRMADATEALVGLAFLQTCAGILTLLGLCVTVHYARKAWVATEGANTINRDALIAAHRPWLKITSHKLGQLEWVMHGQAVVYYSVTVENIGESPAINPRLLSRLVRLELPTTSASIHAESVARFLAARDEGDIILFPEEDHTFTGQALVSFPVEANDEREEFPVDLTLSLVVVYTDGITPERRHTAISGQLWQPIPGGRIASLFHRSDVPAGVTFSKNTHRTAS